MTKKPFVDFRDIRSQITMEQVLEHYNLLGTFKRTGHILIGPCPIHKGLNDKEFHVDLEKNVWTCFSECQHDGNTLDFIAKVERVPIHDAALIACEMFVIPIDDVKIAGDEVEQKTEATGQKPVVLLPASPPHDAKPNPPLKYRCDRLQREHSYLNQVRGLTRETIIDLGLGYFSGKRGMLAGQIVIPIHNVKGEPVAYVGRFPGELAEDTPKCKIPANFNKSQEVFNLDRASREPGSLVIVQGFFDACKLHQFGCRKVVALMDSSMSAAQEDLIREHTDSNTHILIFFNEDREGQIGRDNVAARLAKFRFVKIHVFQKSGMKPEHMTAEEVRLLSL